MIVPKPVTPSKKDQIRTLLKGIETGDPAAVAVVNQAKYIQHNPQTHEGSEGLEALFARLSKTSPRVNLVRVFEDGDYVFAHTEYDFASRRIGFEVFRFEDGFAVEHWDNIQPRRGPNPSGRSMVDGPTEAADHERTEANRELVRAFVEKVLIGRQWGELGQYLDGNELAQHNPEISDGGAELRGWFEVQGERGFRVTYQRLHRLLAEGSFVLSVAEGAVGGVHSALYDLFRVADGKVVEQWNTVEGIAPREEWKNENGKF